MPADFGWMPPGPSTLPPPLGPKKKKTTPKAMETQWSRCGGELLSQWEQRCPRAAVLTGGAAASRGGGAGRSCDLVTQCGCCTCP